ncbi:GNAT family N-acetyltransferase [Kutzneria kofuensis]|uniref:GNAT family N-acetyltransferase n=1 Tax=Kutzneria kofuensis TaxID=103725 RepID=UPI0031E67428
MRWARSWTSRPGSGGTWPSASPPPPSDTSSAPVPCSASATSRPRPSSGAASWTRRSTSHGCRCAPALRRQGTARRLLATLGAWARDCGAQDAVLQVATHNTAAIRLYEGLGFTEHHRYGYWRP